MLADQWNEGFKQLKKNVKTNGSGRVPQSLNTEDGFRLGQWVSVQRTTKNSLSAEQRNLLELLKGWTWDALTDRWNKGFEYLKEFVKRTGSARASTAFKTKDGFALGSWVSVQRQKKNLLTTERRKILESSCKDWTWDARS